MLLGATEAPPPTLLELGSGAAAWRSTSRTASRSLYDAERPLWEKEESVEAMADPAFAFRYLTSIENMAADPGIERVETDGPHRDRVGMRGRTHRVDGGTTDWVVTVVEPDHRFVIDVALRDACLRFDFRFEERIGGGSVVSQRVSLFGPNAGEYLEGVAAGFGTTLRDGMRAVRDWIDAAATNRRGSAPGADY